MSNKLFRKELLSLGHMKESLLMAIEEFIHANPSVQVILTVSPVRHIKDGLMENSRSKARLLELATQLAEHLDYVHYFPAYEIMQDELRDYRYYDRDLIHPSPLAIDIIWQAFVKSLMSSDAQEMVKTTTAIYKDINHRPIVAGTEQHKSFVKNLLKKIERAEKRYPHIKYTKEVRVLKKIL